MSKIEQSKIPVRLGRTVWIIKVSDDKFEGKHPNGINEHYTAKGVMVDPPTVGKPFYVDRPSGYFRTSPVTEIINPITFRTLNSTYKLEYIGEPFEITI